MRTMLTMLGLLLSALVLMGAKDEGTTVRFYRASEVKLEEAARQKVQQYAMTVLKSANFNTSAHAEVLKQSVAEVQEHYRAAVRGNFVVVTFEKPRKVQTVGGEVTAVEIVVGLNREDEYPSGVFAVNAQGKVIAFEKYAPVKWQKEWEGEKGNSL